MKPKPKVGDRLFSLNIGNAARHREQRLTEVEVTKVGRKYFTCGKDKDAYYQVQYHLDGWFEKTDYSANSRLYETPQEWEDEKEASEICKALSSVFEYGYNKRDIPLSDLRKIIDIIRKEATNHD